MGTAALVHTPARKGRVLMIFGPKGGVGKTTITAHLLVSAVKAGHHALGVDFDPQGTLKLWADARDQHPLSAQLPKFDTAQATLDDWLEVWDIIPQYDFVALDMPPGIAGHEAVVNCMAERVHYVLMPTGQSVLDLMHLLPWMMRFAERGIKSEFCLNRIVNPNWTSFKQAKAELVKHGALTPIDIPYREDVIQSARGVAATDSNKMRGNAEFEILWNHVKRAVGL